MPRTFKLSSPIVGISDGYGFNDEPVSIQVSGFFSTEDCEHFITVAEQITNVLHAPITEFGVRPSQIDNLAATIDRDGNGVLYCNEFDFKLGIRLTKHLNKGDGVFDDDILDIEELHLLASNNKKSIDLPRNNAIIFVFSSGWRKGLYFNFSPILPNDAEQLPDLPKLFGTLFCRVRYQEKYQISDDQWRRLTEWEWFPFSCLTKSEMRDLASWSRQPRYPETFLKSICDNYKARLASRIAMWKKRQDLADHGKFIDTAYEAFLADNFIASIQTIMPRVEGILRFRLAKQNPTAKVSQSSMVTNLVKAKNAESLMLPKRFEDFLLACYFKSFDLSKDVLPLSRHTVGHGVAKAEDYTMMRNTTLFMILDEILCFLPSS